MESSEVDASGSDGLQEESVSARAATATGVNFWSGTNFIEGIEADSGGKGSLEFRVARENG